MPWKEVRFPAPLWAAASTRTLRLKLLAKLAVEPRVSLAWRVPLPPPVMLEMDSPLTLGFVTSWKLVALTPLPKARS